MPVQKRALTEHRYIAAATSSSVRLMRPTGGLQKGLRSLVLLLEVRQIMLSGMSIAAWRRRLPNGRQRLRTFRPEPTGR